MNYFNYFNIYIIEYDTYYATIEKFKKKFHREIIEKLQNVSI